MNSYIDIKYLNIIQSSLPLFKKKGDFLWNFRCPYCGDSKKSRSKARGFVFRKKNDLFFKCHNCGVGANLANLIKYVDSNSYDDYILERYKSGAKQQTPEPEFKFNEPVFRKKGILKGLKSIQDLPKEHPARQIIEKRFIPPKSLADLYLCESFYKFTNALVPNKFPSLEGDHPRLVIPFRDEDGEVFAYQGRSFGKEQPKYITIRLDDEHDKIFGLDRIDNGKEIYVTEGPLDSLFLDNCIAVAGSDFSKPLSIGGKLIPNGQLTIVYDNEPRNGEIVKQIERMIGKGRKLVLWPDSMEEKDINDMIVSGMTKEEIQEMIKNNTFVDVEAQLRFAEWRKINV
jgi:transcription elongation factor Elf1